MIKLRLGGEVFEVEKETLLRVKGTYFHGLLSSGAWQPDADGVYYIDRPALGFGRILEYLSSGELSFKGLTQSEVHCLHDNLDYFLIPYRRFDYTTQTLIDGISFESVCELIDGRLCGIYLSDILVWNLDSGVFDMVMVGHTFTIHQVIQLHDGRVCSCSHDKTIKLWSIDNGVCELTLTDHTSRVTCITQLSDGRLCSRSWDDTIRVWNIITGICEIFHNIHEKFYSFILLADDRICSYNDCTISIYNVFTGECELSWEAHAYAVTAIVCIDATRICTCCKGTKIRVWNTDTGECERVLNIRNVPVTSMVLMYDGRLCSVSSDGTLKLWNLDTGECDVTVRCSQRGLILRQQLADGRLLLSSDTKEGPRVFILS